MAFDIRNLSEVRALGNNRWHWHYFTTDSLAACLATDYFSTTNGLSRLHRGDVMEIVASTAAESQQVTISSTAGGSVTLLQSASTDATARTAAATAQAKADAALPATDAALAGLIPGTLTGAAARAQALAATADFTGGATGHQTPSVTTKLSRVLDAKADFGAQGDGTTDDSTALSNFLAATIGTGRTGHIPKGDYIVTPGLVSFTSPSTSVHVLAGEVRTDGAGVRFICNPAVTATPTYDKPLLTIRCADAVADVTASLYNGYLGAIAFVDQTGHTSRNRCGLSISGLEGWWFGPIKGTGLRGDVVLNPRRVITGNDPDPYSIAHCVFQFVSGEQCVGYSIYNGNFIGWTCNIVQNLRAIQCAGLWYGPPDCTRIHEVSSSQCTSWNIDLQDSTFGTSSRLNIGMAELDGAWLGIRVQAFEQLTFDSLRIIHRPYTVAGATDPDGNVRAGGAYWPKTAILIGGGSSGIQRNIRFDFTNRLDPPGGSGCTQSSFGNLIDLANDVNNTGIDINYVTNDNSGLGGLPAANLVVNVSNTADFIVRNAGKTIKDQRLQNLTVVSASSSAVTIPNSGFGTAAAKVLFNSVRVDRNSLWDATNKWFVHPGGCLQVGVAITLAGLTANTTLIRLAIYKDVGGTITLLCYTKELAVRTQQQFRLQTVLDTSVLPAGARVFVMMDQNTGTAANPVAADFDFSAENRASFVVP